MVESTNDFTFESMGMPNSYVMYGPNWARVSAPVFRLHKDILPTLLGLARIEPPGEQWRGRPIHQSTGIIMWPHLALSTMPPPRPIAYELFCKRYIRDHP